MRRAWRATEREEVAADALGGIDEGETGRTGGGGGALGRGADGHPGEHDEPGQDEGAEDQTGAPGRDPRGQRSGGGDTEQSAGVDQLVGGRVEPGAAVTRCRSPHPPIAMISPPTQR